MITKPAIWLAATRPAFLSVTLVAVALGLANAVHQGAPLSFWLAAVTIFFALIAHAGANVINDYYDALSGCDAANTERMPPFTGGSRFIQNRVLTEKQTAYFGYALLCSVIPAGIWLVLQSGAGLLGIGLLGLFCGWAYSARPLKLQSRGLGEIAITIAWMMIVVGTDFVQQGHWSLSAWLIGLAYGLLVANVLFINQIPDRRADAATGKQTIIVRFGPEIAPCVSQAFYFGCTLVLGIAIIFQLLPISSLLALLAAGPAVLALRALFTDVTDRQQIMIAIRMTIMTCLMFGALLAGTLLL